MARRIPDEEVQCVAAAIFEKFGSELSKREFFRQAPFSSGILDARGMLWEDFRVWVGVGKARRRASKQKIHSQGSLREQLIHWAGVLGENISLADFERVTGVSRSTVSQYWESWTELRKGAGLTPQIKWKIRWTEDRLQQELHRVVRRLGRFPTSREFDRETAVSRTTLCRRLGDWETLEQKHLEWVEHQLSQQPGWEWLRLANTQEMLEEVEAWRRRESRPWGRGSG